MISGLSIVSVLCLGAAVLTALRWWRTRVDALGRTRDLPVLSLSLLVVVAVVAAVPGARRGSEERRLERAADKLVGHHVDVHCQTGAHALLDAGLELGYVLFDEDGVPEPETVIKKQPCRDLAAYLRSDKSSPTPDQVVAVHVLTHESMHMRGEVDEAVTECEAVQRDAVTALVLGADHTEALALARAYWRDVYPRMPDDYATTDCAPGRSLDEGLATAPW